MDMETEKTNKEHERTTTGRVHKDEETRTLHKTSRPTPRTSNGHLKLRYQTFFEYQPSLQILKPFYKMQSRNKWSQDKRE